MNSRKTGGFRARRIAAALLCALAAAILLLPFPASAQASDKTVRVGWYDSPFKGASKTLITIRRLNFSHLPLAKTLTAHQAACVFCKCHLSKIHLV